MRTNKHILLLTAASVLLLPAMFVLPFYSFPEYSFVKNTICELGAQHAPNGWIMNFIWVLLALGCVLAGWKSFEGLFLHRAILVLLAISVILFAYFNHAPVNSDIPYNIREAGLNSYFACTSVISFVILTIATSFVADTHHERLIAVTAGICTIVLSVLASESDQLAGIWQRLLLLLSPGWMIYHFKTHE